MTVLPCERVAGPASTSLPVVGLIIGIKFAFHEAFFLLPSKRSLTGAHGRREGALAAAEERRMTTMDTPGMTQRGRADVSGEREPQCFSPYHGRQRGLSAAPTDSGYDISDQNALSAMRRDLHDIVGNALVCMAMELEQLARLGQGDHSKAQVMVAELRHETADLISHVRRLAHGHPTHRVEDVEIALRTMIGRLNHRVGPRLTFTLSFDPAVRLVPAHIGSVAFWITREAIINVVKHSKARNCAVSLTVSNAFLRIQVEDDGVAPAQRQGDGDGLTNIAERAAKHGGWCRASRLQPKGFAVLASLPAFPHGIDSNEREL